MDFRGGLTNAQPQEDQDATETYEEGYKVSMIDKGIEECDVKQEKNYLMLGKFLKNLVLRSNQYAVNSGCFSRDISLLNSHCSLLFWLILNYWISHYAC